MSIDATWGSHHVEGPKRKLGDAAADLDQETRERCVAEYMLMFSETVLPAMTLEQLIWLMWAAQWVYRGEADAKA